MFFKCHLVPLKNINSLYKLRCQIHPEHIHTKDIFTDNFNIHFNCVEADECFIQQWHLTLIYFTFILHIFWFFQSCQWSAPVQVIQRSGFFWWGSSGNTILKLGFVRRKHGLMWSSWMWLHWWRVNKWSYSKNRASHFENPWSLKEKERFTHRIVI